MRRSVGAALLLLGGQGQGRELQAGDTPIRQAYSSEPTPFGWPLTPTDWDFARQGDWPNKFMVCGGERQSPIDIAINSKLCVVDNEGGDGTLAKAAKYNGVASGTVTLSSYLRTAYVNGTFGKLTLDNKGKAAEYEAIQVHLTTPSLHTVNGQRFAAEMLVLHKPKGYRNALHGGVVVSTLFTVGGASSIFSQFGFADDKVPVMLEKDQINRWPAAPIVDLTAITDVALGGPSYFYNGSLPVPPCTENLKWFVHTKTSSVSENQRVKLESVLRGFAGGTTKRAPLPNPSEGKCRQIVKNTVKVGGHHDWHTCHKALLDGTGSWARSAACWGHTTPDKAKKACLSSPIDIKHQQADRSNPPLEASQFIYYKPVTKALMSPGLFTLDAIATVNDAKADFGYILLNGRRFTAHKISVKAISQHTFDGKHHHGELQIEHILYADDIANPYPKPAPQGLPRQLQHYGSNATRDDGMHRVIVSIPLKLGVENALLRDLGIGDPGFLTSVRDGVAYSSVHGVDILPGIAKTLRGPWYWYSGSTTEPTCPQWGVRWMVFSTPAEMSMEQLQFLALPVSGVDSTIVTRKDFTLAEYPKNVWRKFLPSYGVDNNNGVCDDAIPWNYENITCWGIRAPLCNQGQQQSPINIITANVTKVGKDNYLSKVAYKPVSNLRTVNSGNGLQIINEQIGYFEIVGANGFPAFYDVAQVNVHMPSQHLIDGRQYACELHIVHQKQKAVSSVPGHADGTDLLISSIMFDLTENEDSPLLSQMYLSNSTIRKFEWKETRENIDLMRALGPVLEGDFYRYDGALTTPPCSELVKWFVFATPLKMSRKQWNIFKAMYPNPANNRPVVPLYGRKVAKNSFQDGKLKEFDYYLTRDAGRNTELRGPAYILFPIIGTILLACFIMWATFVREDRRRRRESAGGLADTVGTIGKGQYSSYV